VVKALSLGERIPVFKSQLPDKIVRLRSLRNEMKNTKITKNCLK